jgi:hypothetical protein
MLSLDHLHNVEAHVTLKTVNLICLVNNCSLSTPFLNIQRSVPYLEEDGCGQREHSRNMVAEENLEESEVGLNSTSPSVVSGSNPIKYRLYAVHVLITLDSLGKARISENGMLSAIRNATSSALSKACRAVRHHAQAYPHKAGVASTHSPDPHTGRRHRS